MAEQYQIPHHLEPDKLQEDDLEEDTSEKCGSEGEEDNAEEFDAVPQVQDSFGDFWFFQKRQNMQLLPPCHKH